MFNYTSFDQCSSSRLLAWLLPFTLLKHSPAVGVFCDFLIFYPIDAIKHVGVQQSKVRLQSITQFRFQRISDKISDKIEVREYPMIFYKYNIRLTKNDHKILTSDVFLLIDTERFVKRMNNVRCLCIL